MVPNGVPAPFRPPCLARYVPSSYPTYLLWYFKSNVYSLLAMWCPTTSLSFQCVDYLVKHLSLHAWSLSRLFLSWVLECDALFREFWPDFNVFFCNLVAVSPVQKNRVNKCKWEWVDPCFVKIPTFPSPFVLGISQLLSMINIVSLPNVSVHLIFSIFAYIFHPFS